MSEPVIYLDNAATSFPKPPSVYNSMHQYFTEVGGSPGRSGHRLARQADELVWQVRDKLASFFNIHQPYRIAFVPNATVGLNIAIKGFLNHGDNVLVTSHDHNSILRPLESLKKAKIIDYNIIAVNDKGEINLENLEEVFKKQRPKLITVTHASNVTGSILPLLEIVHLAQQYQVHVLLDASQTAGVIPIDIASYNDGIDFLVTSGHKSLLGPQGTGLIYVSHRVQLTSLIEGGTGSNSSSLEHPEQMPAQIESGTLNAVGMAGLGGALDYLVGKRLKEIRSHESLLMQELLNGLTQIDGVTVYGTGQASNRIGVVSFNIDRFLPSEVSYILDDSYNIMSRSGLHCAPLMHREMGTISEGTIRFSLSPFNTTEEIAFVIQAVREIATRKKS